MADKLARAMAYLDRLPVAVSGAGGHNATLRAACECFRFGLSEAEAKQAMDWFNEHRCQPKWKAPELAHKLASAREFVSLGGQDGKHLGKERGRAGRKSNVFVPPAAPKKRITLRQPVQPVWNVSAEEEERRWVRVASELGLTLAEFDIRCGVETGVLL